MAGGGRRGGRGPSQAVGKGGGPTPERQKKDVTADAPAPTPAPDAQRLCRGLQPVARLVPTLARRGLGAKGVALGSLIADWPSLVGPRLAERTVPVKVAFPQGERTGGQVHVRVSGSAALEVQHAEPQILDRINSFFGYKAVVRLKLVQAPLPSPARQIVRRPLGAAEEDALRESVAAIDDAGLREALLGFGRAMAQRTRR